MEIIEINENFNILDLKLENAFCEVMKRLNRQSLKSLRFIDLSAGGYQFSYVVICICLSNIQTSAVSDEIIKAAKEQGCKNCVKDGGRGQDWNAVFVPDFNAIFHLMTATKYEEFNIEKIVSSIVKHKSDA
jgi:ribosomal silencing factor RsfS